MKRLSQVRERAEEIERASLSTWATLASETKGRDRYEDADPLRTAFQQDRERLVRSDVWAKLARRTHSFVPDSLAGVWQTRLSHTLATVALTRTLARALRLNEDLAEAVASAHALGAPPFGAAGGQALSEVLGHQFEVCEQSLRIVEHLEPGLNLTWEVRDGILHQGAVRSASTLEGMTAAVGRRLAELLFGLRAAERAGIVRLDDMPSAVRKILGTDHDQRVATTLQDAVAVSSERPEVGLSDDVDEALGELEAFLEEAVHGRDAARAEHDRAVHALRSLAIYAEANPAVIEQAGDDPTHVADWLASRTDREVVDLFTTTFSPWGPTEG